MSHGLAVGRHLGTVKTPGSKPGGTSFAPPSPPSARVPRSDTIITKPEQHCPYVCVASAESLVQEQCMHACVASQAPLPMMYGLQLVGAFE